MATAIRKALGMMVAGKIFARRVCGNLVEEEESLVRSDIVLYDCLCSLRERRDSTYLSTGVAKAVMDGSIELVVDVCAVPDCCSMDRVLGEADVGVGNAIVVLVVEDTDVAKSNA